MREIDGQFFMDGCAADDPARVETPEQLAELLRSVGFLPLFANAIPGFSVEEHAPSACWWTGAEADPWEWRHILAEHPELAYGKFFGKKAGFIHRDWFPVFANYRRGGYDFDALYEDGLARYTWKTAMELFGLDEEMRGRELPASQLAGEGVRTELQMRCYLIVSRFTRKRNKAGEPYGWHYAMLETPETKWGYETVAAGYREEPAQSWEKIKGQVLRLYPTVQERDIRALLGMRSLTRDDREKERERP